MAYTPETLRTVFARSTAKRGKWTLGMLEVELEMHADAWEEEQNEHIRRHEEWLLERSELLDRIEALEKAGQAMLDATVEGKVTVGHQRDLAAALAAGKDGGAGTGQG